MPYSLNRLTIFLILILPIIGELFRKYVLYSNVWLIVVDLILVLIFIRTLSKFKPPAIFNYWVFFVTIFTIHGLAFSIIELREPYSIIFGLRTAFYPMVGFLVASSVNFDKDFTAKLMRVTLTLLLLISIFGLLQVSLDSRPWEAPIHWINYYPSELNYGCPQACSMGYGGSPFDNAGAKYFGVTLYRPHSIFLHTGKFGQVVFALGAIVLLLAKDLSPKNKGIIIFIIIACNFVTSQRAALYSLLFFAILYIYLFSNNRKNLTIGLLIISFFIIILDAKAIIFIVVRIFSIIPELPSRLELFYQANGLLDNGLLGDGWGFFAPGSQFFGGGSFQLVYGGEGAWIIVAGELGIPISITLAISNLIFGILIFFRSFSKSHDNYLSFWTSFVILVLFLWACTHNIFGSYLMMLYALIPIGLYFNKSFNLKIKDNIF